MKSTGPSTETPVMRGLRWLLAALLLWAAVSKLANAHEFLGDLYGYELPLPRGLLKLVAVALPWVELCCGLLLLGGWWCETALLLVGALFVGFVLATGQAWLRGLPIACGCFDFRLLGLDPEGGLVRVLESPGVAFLRNLLLLAAVAWLFRPVCRAWRGEAATTGG